MRVSYIHTCVCMYEGMYVCVQVCMCLCMNVCMYLCMLRGGRHRRGRQGREVTWKHVGVIERVVTSRYKHIICETFRITYEK
jgi:hypothetical protein